MCRPLFLFYSAVRFKWRHVKNHKELQNARLCYFTIQNAGSTVIPRYPGNWFQRPLIPKFMDTQVPYINWQSTVGSQYTQDWHHRYSGLTVPGAPGIHSCHLTWRCSCQPGRGRPARPRHLPEVGKSG